MIRSTPEKGSQTVSFETKGKGQHIFHFCQGRLVAVQFLPAIEIKSVKVTATMYSNRAYDNNILISRWVKRLSKKHMNIQDYSFVSYGTMSDSTFNEMVANILDRYSAQFFPHTKRM